MYPNDDYDDYDDNNNSATACAPRPRKSSGGVSNERIPHGRRSSTRRTGFFRGRVFRRGGRAARREVSGQSRGNNN